MSNDERSSSETVDSARSSWSSESLNWWDDWPPDFDGTGLFQRLESEDHPLFRFDVREVLKEVEGRLGGTVVDIPRVGKGSNYFGMHLCLAGAAEVLVRIARCDVNSLVHAGAIPEEIADLLEQQARDVQFEAEIYQLLSSHREVLTSDLLYHRAPTYTPNAPPPCDTLGRALFIFAKTDGASNVWPEDAESRFLILEQCARLRATLFRLTLPTDFITLWLTRCPPSAKSIPGDITPTREFAIAFLRAKIAEMIPDEGGLIGWEEDHTLVGPRASAAKKSLLRLVPLIMPPEGDHPYRLVLEHGDFGMHNMVITDPPAPRVTSLYDWETAHIVPALLSDPQMATYVDLGLDGEGVPRISRTWEGMTDEECDEYASYAAQYYRILGEHAPEYVQAIKAGKDARRIWFALKAWRGDDPEEYFGELGEWADRRFQEIAGDVDGS
ncbi:hypothetical protein DFH07DRAFT_160412 [Mycena maculata]|uniref:Aminoglycoside phosphotransferase domain-containing protein n=1 Tax=Mycena maculata TaxID=230809 RepID=A0AAD7MSM6_9AGAR|nr:hypothetical protein DFH07DRAFT_160412 [Mycena maculata]